MCLAALLSPAEPRVCCGVTGAERSWVTLPGSLPRACLQVRRCFHGTTEAFVFSGSAVVAVCLKCHPGGLKVSLLLGSKSNVFLERLCELICTYILVNVFHLIWT